MLHDFMYVTLVKYIIIRMEFRLGVARGLEMGVGREDGYGCHWVGMRVPCGHGTVKLFVVMVMQVYTCDETMRYAHIHTQMSARITSAI